MATKPRAITVKGLQSLLVRIGLASSGTKAILEGRFRHNFTKPRLFARHPEWEASRPTDQKLRIMSIDMGIKNLAFCEAEVSYPVKDGLNAKMDILRWERVDLASTRHQGATESSQPDTTRLNDAEAGANEEVDPYSLDTLSKTAYKLIKETILSGSPDVILIEKQRWRSGGGSAVQQWTLRVNTLEGMLWAVLETIQNETDATQTNKEKKNLYDVFAVDPKRVGHYWLGQNDQRLATDEATSSPAKDIQNEAEDQPTLSRSKAEKKAKISLLRSWLTASPPSTSPTVTKSTPPISFVISNHAQPAYRALCFPRRKKQNSEFKDAESVIGDISGSEMKKLDDVTDCFLQAAAWVSWESNRQQLCDIWRRNVRRDGSLMDENEVDLSELNNDRLLEMWDEVEG
ncbi:hypothetical protein COCC4DRAFT_52109 [Bipolaris maydis ATCC 48331]|uniref:Mitochondrial resolvase Ydc2 catalytic domain-containing protein n=2 Tax=Cochliobolus heterostrophus TaxID=5016 RepID=M2TJV5_COCH5|nr:uncharacterized protein COCC4DRAFT_52109 [Bipolaris maydis ATCC 48331]EMD97740.1 hypothetical protein COCHEDRAFT_1190509 [Bipolaris maydis C5]KAH7564556.1 hypothetical protein BM1_01603 [Bipolaris maydis]ENI02864.1 hypothetical protein COCC4DRAFT_52109 [Bipolaris maydis ATCC 48331]KAJ5031823.1 mitochondrial resolvase Ydc2 [Bipolaris maydis]KAJ5060121.1 mitochondrial resolvase Ydc2 [Bipolaris maydis]